MKIGKITSNKTAEQPDGVEIEIVQSQNDLQVCVLSFLLTSFLRERNCNGRISCDLPDDVFVPHKAEGTFVVAAPTLADEYYQMPCPIAVVAIYMAGTSFDVIHAPPIPQTPSQAQGRPSEQVDPLGNSAES